MTEPLIFEIGGPGRCAASLPAPDVPLADLPRELLRDDLMLPEVGELDLVRHYVRLSHLNHAVDTGFYPLGSCTMKYNPKVNESAARMTGFAHTHPYQDECIVQGNLRLMYELQEFLKEISGFAAVSLQPAAGAHGEFAGVLMIRAYHEARGDAKRKSVLVPDSAHGTNPASTAMCGYDVVEIRSDARGNVDLDDLRAHCNETVAGMMLTNPNTLGLFDENVVQVCELVHACGGLMYGDGANLNAIMGIVRPADLGFDVMHFNLHKTFSTPHGGGGPGSGPVGVGAILADFLPGPIAAMQEEECECTDEERECTDEECGCHDEGPGYVLQMPPRSIGRMKAFYGNFGVLVKAYTYIRQLGAEGIRRAAEYAVLSANYLRVKLQDTYPLPYRRVCMHEFVLSGKQAGAPDVRTMDIAKRLMDFGFHPPTVYFPLIVPEALMIEPTETESLETLDAFADAMLQIAEEARTNPELLHGAPHGTPVKRLDDVRAAREPRLCWRG
jgi:glycine dehydrogenase subunit 2